MSVLRAGAIFLAVYLFALPGVATTGVGRPGSVPEKTVPDTDLQALATGAVLLPVIYGGKPVLPDLDPLIADIARMMVPILVSMDDWAGHCSGVIISSTQILTAGHCIWNANKIRILWDSKLTGDLPTRFHDDPEDRGDEFDVQYPPGYEGTDSGIRPLRFHDLALITLKRSVPKSFHPVPIADTMLSGALVTLAGFGNTSLEKDDAGSLVLRYGSARVFRRSVGILQMQSKATGLCNHDSGGPWLLRTDTGWELVGISRGGNCKTFSTANDVTKQAILSDDGLWLRSRLRH